jgi:hypothetical protein
LALVLVLAFPLPAGAAYDPIGGGATRLVLDRHFTAFLERAGVSLAAEAGAVKRGRTLILPVTGGSLDPIVGRGEVEQEGRIVFSSSRRRLPVRKLAVKMTNAPLVARVGGSQLKVATSTATKSKRRGFGTVFSARKLELTEKVATQAPPPAAVRSRSADRQARGGSATAAHLHRPHRQGDHRL